VPRTRRGVETGVPAKALAVTIGLPDNGIRLIQHDLDDFLEPLATEFASPRPALVSATKAPGPRTTPGMGPVQPGEDTIATVSYARIASPKA
jgi:hypothetical protein